MILVSITHYINSQSNSKTIYDHLVQHFLALKIRIVYITSRGMQSAHITACKYQLLHVLANSALAFMFQHK